MYIGLTLIQRNINIDNVNTTRISSDLLQIRISYAITLTGQLSMGIQ